MDSVLVYRDTVGARSESFIQRQYMSFKTLRPFYVGTKRGPLAPKDALILAAPGPLGWVARTGFRQFGHMPAKLDSAIGKHHPRLIHAQFGLGGALALPIARRAGLPLVVTFHGGDATKDKHFERRAMLPTIFQRRHQAMVETAQAILCVSQFVRDRLIARGFPRPSCEPIISASTSRRRWCCRRSASATRFLFVGRLVEKKGVDTLIDAMAMARQLAPSLELSIVGDGPARADLERRAKAAGVKVTFQGWLPEKGFRPQCAAPCCSRCPAVPLMAAIRRACRPLLWRRWLWVVPVIATRHAGIPEIISDGVTGMLVPEADAAALAAAITALKDDPDLAGRLRGEAYADVRARFDAARQSVLLERMLLDIIQASSK